MNIARAIAALGLVLVLAGCTLGSKASPPRPSAAVTVAPGAPGWSSRAAAPAMLTEVAGAAFGGELWIVGGLEASRAPSARVFAYDPATDSWREGPPLPSTIHHSAMVATADGLLVIGGYPQAALEGPTDKSWLLAPGAAEWTAGVPLPEPRGAGAAAWDGQRVVYGGGVGPAGVSDTVWALQDGQWSVVGRLSRAREHLAATSGGDGRAWFLGGRVSGLAGNMGTVDLVEGSEIRQVGEVPTTRGGVAAFWSPEAGACLVGGESPGGTNAQVECIDGDGKTTELPRLRFPRHGLAAAVIGGLALVALGGPQPGLFVSDTLEALPLSR